MPKSRRKRWKTPRSNRSIASSAPETEESTGFEDTSVEPGVWRYVHAKRASVIVDAEDYFYLMQQAMLKARKRILLIGWDLDTRIHLEKGRRWFEKFTRRGYPSRLGSFIMWLNRHRDELEIRILKWSYGFLQFPFRGSMMLDLARWFRHRRIGFNFDTAHPVGCSHHQKIAVLDDRVAVCGGIDMTSFRWDTREHKENDPRRKRPRGQAYGPWHDATMMVEGEIAVALGELGRQRWKRAGGKPLGSVKGGADDIWPEELPAQFEDVEIGIARTRAKYRDWGEVKEIAVLFERQIASARKFIYAESQYFASRRVADALCKRLSEPEPPEIMIVHPRNADGWLEQQAMDKARAVLVRTLGEIDPGKRFNLYVPYTGETPIYVHAKIMIVDDRILRIGSANLNNRSLGLDSECDLFIDCERPGNGHCREAIRKLRHSLLAEHCGLEEEEVPQLLSRYGSMANMVENLGRERQRTLRRFDLEALNGLEETLAESALLDPEGPDEMFEPFANGGLFRKRSRLRTVKSKTMQRNNAQ